ncbi:MAG: hypothetical protein ABW174_04455, partial [Flavitalea sp.]
NGSETLPNGSSGMGAPGNGGGGATDGSPGGGNDQNAGGGGGGNGGVGGRGGKSWNSNLQVGGFGGVKPAFLAVTRLIMGGGGGAGSTNNGTGPLANGLSSSGAAGGGIVIIKLAGITGSGSIVTNGDNAETVDNDGAGGGGAGGTVYITATSGLANVTATANGGAGGNAWPTSADAGGLDDGNPEHGPGGGGGGGVVYSNTALNGATTVAGGARGTTLTNTQAFGTTVGAGGVVTTGSTVIALTYSIFCDGDDDNDGIPDLNEYISSADPYGDADGDNIPNMYDNAPGSGVPAWVDANGDGINDAYDIDRDGIINSEDLDADGDGIPDIVEAGGVDVNGDGVADALTDTNNNGVPDRYDIAVAGGVSIPMADTDGDGVPNFRDLDSDNDGIPDVVEVGGVDANGDGILDNFDDADGDGLDNTVDGDADNNGIAENTARALLVTGPDANNDGLPDSWPQGINNTDGRGNPNPYDLDSDDDGIPDIIEAGGADADYNGRIDGFTDTDGDGFANSVDGDADNNGVAENTANALLVTGPDANNDGKADSYAQADNADGTGMPNPYDVDADDDGIPDLIESGGVDSNGDGRIDGTTDANNNGWIDTYDPTASGINIRTIDANGAAAAGAVFDFDTDGVPNYLDLDSDNDGIPDVAEQGGTDANNDGKVDGSADVDNDGFIDGVDPINNNTAAALGTAIITTGTTLSAQNIPTTYSAGDDQDKTGLINMLDLDADGDGILDVREAGFTDSDNNGVVDGTLGTDGWSDPIDALSSLNLPNTDGRGVANYLDIDSDDDGITDNVEGQTTSGYQLPAGTDSDMDGIDDNYDNNDNLFAGASNNGIIPNNNDGTDVADYLDSDSDNDGTNDLIEGSGIAGNTLTNLADTDNDGLLDQFDTFNMNSQTSNLQNNVTNTGMGNGGSTTGPSTAGSNISAVKSSPAYSDRDWRFNPTLLPVNFINVTVNAATHGNIVGWTVENEATIKYYVVERSTNGHDFTDLGIVHFVDVDGRRQTYNYADESATGNALTMYYRIRQVDPDNKFTLSKIVNIQLTGRNNKLTMLGNPVTGSQVLMNISAEKSGVATIRLVDISGKVLVEETTPVAAGNNQVRLPLDGRFTNSIYFVSVKMNGVSLLERISVSR